MLTRDAFDEFARTNHNGIKAFKEQMDSEQLVAWIKDFSIPASRRRLYFTMLGVCGSPDHAAMLEEMMNAEDRKAKAGLDAMIACYLSLIGESGVPVVERLFLKNQDAEYTDTYAAIMALRFHGGQSDTLSKDRIVKALRCMLERPQLADLVVPDLARWEAPEWQSMPRLIQLFKDATEENSWVRVPVINYLRKCDFPEADKAISELEKIDPDAVRRAKTFFPGGPEDTAKDAEQSDKIDSATVNDKTPKLDTGKNETPKLNTGMIENKGDVKKGYPGNSRGKFIGPG